MALKPLVHVSKLFLKEELSDVLFVVKSTEGQERRFYGHRLLLGACSPFWKALLYGSFKEASEKEVTLNDIDGDVFETVLRFVYHGTLHFNGVGVAAVMTAAVQFQMDTLLAACVEHVHENMAVDVCCDVLSVECGGALIDKLKATCKYFLLAHCRSLKNEVSLLKAMSQDTLTSILLTDGIIIEEHDVFSLVQSWCAAHATNSNDKKEMKSLYAPFESLVRYGLLDKNQLRSLVRESGLVRKSTLLDAWEMISDVGPNRHLRWDLPRNCLFWKVAWCEVRRKKIYHTTPQLFAGHTCLLSLEYDMFYKSSLVVCLKLSDCSQLDSDKVINVSCTVALSIPISCIELEDFTVHFHTYKNDDTRGCTIHIKEQWLNELNRVFSDTCLNDDAVFRFSFVSCAVEDAQKSDLYVE